LASRPGDVGPKSAHDNNTWVAEADDTVAGFVNVIFNANRSAAIYMIAVDPAAQRRGIARH
jgi:ribosomal protein S18 acetylase RimI-like enzyme